MLWGGRWEGGSCLGTHVRIKDFKIKKKIKSFCTTKETISKGKTQPSELEKIIANEATDN